MHCVCGLCCLSSVLLIPLLWDIDVTFELGVCVYVYVYVCVCVDLHVAPPWLAQVRSCIQHCITRQKTVMESFKVDMGGWWSRDASFSPAEAASHCMEWWLAASLAGRAP